MATPVDTVFSTRVLVAKATTNTWLLLVLATVFTTFSNGAYIIPLAAWLSPIFILLVSRQATTIKRSIGLTFTVCMVSTCIFHWGVVPEFLPLPLRLIIIAFYGLLYTIPFVIDRALTPRLSGIMATLVLPAAWVSLDWIYTYILPYSSWGNLAYSQIDNLAFAQLASVTGMHGITFVMTWLASVAVFCILSTSTEQENRQADNTTTLNKAAYHKALVTVITVIIVTVMWGGIRLLSAPSLAGQGETVRFAGVTVKSSELQNRFIEGFLEGGFGHNFTPAEMDTLRNEMLERQAQLLQLSAQQADQGAQIVFWSETNGTTLKTDEQAFIDQGRALAQTKGIYLIMALETTEKGATKRENKIITLTPQGEQVTDYYKSYPIPAEPSVKGNEQVAIIDTPLGRIGLVICFDMDFPHLLQSAGKNDVDFLIAPSQDWLAIHLLHSQMARMRAIESGFNLIRQSEKGLSVTTDASGRLLSEMNYFINKEKVNISNVPKQSIKTVYSIVGDSFPIIVLVLMAFISASAFRTKSA